MLFVRIWMRNESLACHLTWKMTLGDFCIKGWIMEFPQSTKGGHFCLFMQVSKIMDAF